MAVFLLAACAPSTPPTATPAPTEVAPPTLAAQVATAPATAAPFVMSEAIARFADIPTSTTQDGFARLGFPNAPISVSAYANFDEPASIAFARNSLPALIDHARAGEILLTFVPLAGATEARGAARAAACAAEGGAFWPFQAALYAEGTAPDATRIVAIADELASAGALNRVVWDSCMSSNRPDDALAQGEAAVRASDYFTAAPYVTVNDLPSLADPDSLNFTIDLALQQFNQSLEGALADSTAEATPELVITLEAELGEGTPPPIVIGLPAGWEAGYAQIPLNDIDAIRYIPVAVYSGPVTGGTGSLVLLWGFPNISGGATGDPAATTDLFLDGLRLLRLAIVEPTCNVGTDLRRDYAIGGLAAVGTQFSAVDCGDLPDTRGWFAGINQYGLNYMFFAYTDPITAMDTAEGELQAILDTIRFPEIIIPEATAASAEATAAP